MNTSSNKNEQLEAAAIAGGCSIILAILGAAAFGVALYAEHLKEKQQEQINKEYNNKLAIKR
ncbi:hypothetical protein E0E54_19605 [Azotobacter chroococcum]|uniref:hypothetical protein n=1 Tax=Azotobacter chroococcum TaxID=353 RepID=UPI00103F8CC4|nr:hypothetical protein [Azotobacter chroococcum]TBW32293.1 hypothetical protein E0E54_19605 [Azotobacter chroococcum]